jgi:hypothetical protein
MARTIAATRTSASARRGSLHPLNPTVWFPFTEATAENRVDVVNGLVAVPGSPTAVVAANGITGFGATFDSTNVDSIMRIASTPLLSPAGGPFTVVCWCFPTSAGANPVFWSKWDSGAGFSEWEFPFVSSNSKWQLNISANGVAAAGVQTTLASVTLNAWNLVIGWWNPTFPPRSGVPGTGFIQVNNGAITRTNIGTTIFGPSSADSIFGGFLANNVPVALQQFPGTLCDPMFFNRALTQSERDWLWNGGVGRMNKNLQGAQGWRNAAGARLAS